MPSEGFAPSCSRWSAASQATAYAVPPRWRGPDGWSCTITRRVLSALPLLLGYVRVVQAEGVAPSREPCLKRLPLLLGYACVGRCGWSRTTAVRLMKPTSSKERSEMRRHDLHVRPSAHEADELLLLHSAVETGESRTRILRVQTGCSPVELQPQTGATDVARCGNRELHPDLELGTLASCYWTMAAWWSPRPELHRSLPFTKRLLDFRAAGTLIDEPCAALLTRVQARHQRKDSNLHLSD